MSSLHQPLPLNHPPPRQQLPQPPLKKPRINAKPKLTPHQITQPAVIQSALRIGREARQKVPQPGHGQHAALDSLLRNMQSWANQLSPQYSLAEFVLAAQAISGNRELRPMLAEFRLAELRDVNSEHQPEEAGGDADDNTQDGNGVVQADAGPVEADVGPVEADVGPEDDDWDELDLVPDEAIEIRPIRSNPTTASPPKTNQNDIKDSLSADIEAKIEQNRRAAVERRKAVIARLQADKEAEEKQTTQQADDSHKKSSDAPVDCRKQENSNPESQAATLSNASPAAPGKGKQPSPKLDISTDDSPPSSGKAVLKDVDGNTEGEKVNDAASKADIRENTHMDAPNKPAVVEDGSQKHDESKERPEKEKENNRDLSSSEATFDPKASESVSPKEDNADQDVDMEILAEFEDGDDA